MSGSNVAFPKESFAWQAFDTAQPSTSANAPSGGTDGPARRSSAVLALDTVADFVKAARALLQDASAPYRYPDEDLVFALNLAMLEARRMRPDLYVLNPTSTVMFVDADDTRVPIDPAYRAAHLYYMCGHVQLRDDDSTQDARAASFMTRFTTQMLSMTG